MYSPATTHRMWAHPVLSRSKRRSDYVRGIGAATDPSGQQITPALSSAGQALLTRLDAGVPYEGTADGTVQAFQQEYLNAGFTLTDGADGKYGPYTAQALSFVTGANVPAPNTTAPGGGPVTPPAPSPSPAPSPTPQNVPVTRASTGSGMVWLAILAAVGFAGYEAWKKRRGARKENPCHRMLSKRRPRATVLLLG